MPGQQCCRWPSPVWPAHVTIAGDGRIHLQDSTIELDQLGPRLLAITEQNREARIFVRGDRAIDYGRVMAVVGAINQAGFTKVALLTEAPTRRTAEASGVGAR